MQFIKRNWLITITVVIVAIAFWGIALTRGNISIESHIYNVRFDPSSTQLIGDSLKKINESSELKLDLYQCKFVEYVWKEVEDTSFDTITSHCEKNSLLTTTYIHANKFILNSTINTTFDNSLSVGDVVSLENNSNLTDILSAYKDGAVIGNLTFNISDLEINQNKHYTFVKCEESLCSENSAKVVSEYGDEAFDIVYFNIVPED